MTDEEKDSYEYYRYCISFYKAASPYILKPIKPLSQCVSYRVTYPARDVFACFDEVCIFSECMKKSFNELTEVAK